MHTLFTNTVLSVAMATIILSCHPAYCYKLDPIPSQGANNTLVVDMVVDRPSKNTVVVSYARAIGDDRWVGSGNACYGPVGAIRSCMVVYMANGKKFRQFQQNVRACLPGQGDGTLADAATAFIQQHFVSRAIPQIGSNTWAAERSELWVGIQICGQSNHIVYQTEGSPSSPVICTIDAPALVELGTLTTSSTRVVRAGINCTGGGESDVRVSVQGPATIRPVRGLELWASAPERALHITGDGAPTYVDLTVGATIANPKPGFYSGSFVYKIEYL